MNERILELIGPAQKEVWGNNPYNGSPEFEGYELDVEKFAELIVRECLGIVNDAERGGDNEIWDNAVKFIIRDLKQHFGVEE